MRANPPTQGCALAIEIVCVALSVSLRFAVAVEDAAHVNIGGC